MSSSSNDSQSPPPPPPPAPARTKPDGAPPKVRGLFGKQSVPPPPAGKQSLPPPPAARGPIASPKTVETHVLRPPVLGAPDLPATVNTMDDPLAGLFGDGALPQAPEPSETAWSVHDEPTRSVPREELMLASSSETSSLFESAPPTRPSIPPDHAPVAKLGLAKTMLAGAAHEVMTQELMAHEPHRDPRAEPNASARPSQSAHRDLVGVVFDPDQSVARHLGEVAIDGEVGSTAPSDALRDLPLPKVPSVPAPMAPIDEVPVRSMRGAMVIISLVLISGGAATLVSLGVVGGSPARLRQENAETQAARAAATQPADTTPATAPATTTPATTAPAPNAPQAEKTAVPEPVAEPAVEPKPEEAPAKAQAVEVEASPVVPASAVLPVTAVVSGDPITAGDTLLRADDLDGAMTQYQTALTADPRDHHAMEGLARIHLARGKATEALALADQIVKRRPKRAAYRILQGQARSALGDRAGARTAFQEALALEPDNRDAQRLLGQ